MKGYTLISGAGSPLGIELCKSITQQKKECIAILHGSVVPKPLLKIDPDLIEFWDGDLSCAAVVEDISERIVSRPARLWAFVHIAAGAPEDNCEFTELQRSMSLNVLSGWHIAKICIKKMADGGGGRIVFIGSVGHRFGGKESRVGYGGSKYLLEYFPRVFRDCAGQNVLVNTLRLGVMAGGTQSKTGVTNDAFLKRVSLIPTKKAISQNEAVANINHLISDQNISIHNSVLACTGGE